MNTIPHADMIRAVLDGKVVQARTADGKGWYDLGGTAADIAYICNYPSVAQDGGPRFRLKPKSSVSWHPVWRPGHVGFGFATKWELLRDSEENMYASDFKVLRLELDSETLEVISTKMFPHPTT